MVTAMRAANGSRLRDFFLAIWRAVLGSATAPAALLIAAVASSPALSAVSCKLKSSFLHLSWRSRAWTRRPSSFRVRRLIVAVQRGADELGEMHRAASAAVALFDLRAATEAVGEDHVVGLLHCVLQGRSTRSAHAADTS